ncbi:MAG: hypothetical protein ACE5G0_12855 [Rhodothermales bacterium]
MKRTMPLLSFLTLLLFAGCSLFGYGDSESSFQAGEVISLEEGNSANLSRIPASFRFIEKMADSRCPIGVTCIWEGEVKVAMEFTRNGQAPAPFTMKGFVGPQGDETVSLDTLGYRFTLERVDPYPQDGAPSTDPSTATVRIRQL